MSLPFQNTPTSPETRSPIQPTEDQRSLRIALIGVTGFATVHLEMIRDGQNRGLAQLAAATIINPDEAPETFKELSESGVQIFQDYREMLKAMCGKIDLCFIPTGIHLHAPMTIAALEAGAHVFVEKPAAATVQEVDAMQAAAKQAERFVAVGYQHMYAQETFAIKQAILSGRIGRLRSIKCLGLWPRPQSYYERNNWAGRLRLRDQWLLDSPFNNALSHQLNLMCFLAGETLETSAQVVEIEAELYRARDIESPDTASLRGLTPNGASVYFFGTHCSRYKQDPIIHIIGERGRIEWDFAETRIMPDGGPTETITNQPIPEVRMNMMDTLASLCAGRNAFICDLSIARAQTLMTNGAHESAPVLPIPTEFIEHEESEGEHWRIVRDIEALLQQCFDREKLLSQTDCPWGRPSEKVELSNYDQFPQHVELDAPSEAATAK